MLNLGIAALLQPILCHTASQATRRLPDIGSATAAAACAIYNSGGVPHVGFDLNILWSQVLFTQW